MAQPWRAEYSTLQQSLLFGDYSLGPLRVVAA
jgi:hypothetical protein